MRKITIKDIIKSDLCVGSGVCTSESKSSRMVWNEYGFLVPDLDGSFNDMAIKVNPFNPYPDEEVKDEDKIAELFLKSAANFHSRIGKYISIYAGNAPQFRLSSSSGGIGTYLFSELLKRKIVDYVFTVVEVNGSYEYDWVNDFKEIKRVSKTRYYPVTLERLFKEIHQKEGKIAVSAIPSFVKAIRLKQYYYPELKDKIVFIQGIICGGIKSRFFTEYLAQKAGIAGDYSKAEYRLKDLKSTATDYAFGAFNKNQNFQSVKMRKVGNTWGTSLFNANGYDFSTDVTAELADISLGDAWMNPYKNDGAGNNVIVTRSEIADMIIQDGIRSGELNVDRIEIDQFIKSQAGGIRHKQKAIKYRLRRQKKKYGIVPYIRPRMLESIPWEFKLVQLIRMDLREKSLRIWRENPNSEAFDKAIKLNKMMLRIATLVYHKTQRLRGKLGIKTI